MNHLARRTLIGFGELVVVMGIALFAPAGTLDYPRGWVYLCVFGASAALVTIYLWRADPQLLERRLNAGPAAEKQRSQQVIQLLAALAFVGMLVVPSLDHRFGWSHVPLVVALLGDVLVALGFLIVLLVFKENTFTAATIEVAAGQQVISTGPYALVRHPMYAGALVLLFGTPLALGSWWGLVMVLVIGATIVWRLLEEERFLSTSLGGYTAYRQRVRYRLIPRLW